ncbi:ABC transporter substrate-binding protein [Nocardioides hungaricus]
MRSRPVLKIKMGVAVAAAAALALSACSSGREPGSLPDANADLQDTTPKATADYGSITWANYRAPTTLDPLQAEDQPENAVVNALCEGLLMQEPDGKIAPWLAESVDYTTPTTITVKLRDGVTFWDGTPMTAQDVAYSLDRARDVKTGSYYAARLTSISSVEVAGDNQVDIRLSQPDYWIEGLLANMPGIVVQKALAERVGKAYGTKAENVMCTGPYQVASWKAGGDVTIARNDSYWDEANRAKVSQITFTAVPSDSDLTAGLTSGDINGTFIPVLSTYEQLKGTDSVTVTTGWSPNLDVLPILGLDGVLGDVRVRRALSLAIDRQAYLGVAYPGGQASIPRTSTNSSTWRMDSGAFESVLGDVGPMTQDLAEAKKLISEAGASGETIVMAASSGLPSTISAANAVIQAGKAIGLEVELKNLPISQYVGMFYDPAARKGIDLYDTISGSSVAEPGPFLAAAAVPGGSYNLSNWSNAKVTQLLEQARGTADASARAKLEAQADRIVTEQLPWITLAEQNNSVFMSTSITGAPASAVGYLNGPWTRYLGAAGS